MSRRTVGDMDDWRPVWQAINHRREVLGWSLAQLYRATVSDATLGPMKRSGKPVVRSDIKRRITDGLGWSPDSLDLILSGHEPVVIGLPPTTQPSGLPDEISRLPAVVAELQLQVVELARIVHAMDANVALLLDARHAGAPRPGPATPTAHPTPATRRGVC